ncbi:electron transport complex subunit D [Spirochaetia bacterium]|nr:electron transport complex subunit D [Spirochaetia bacterium]
MAESTTIKQSPQAGPPAALNPVLLASSPHIGSPVAARQLMCRVLIALTPVTVFGIVLYGLSALATVVVSIAAAEIAELLFRLVTRQDIRNKDLSAAVTGLLLALVLPPSTPLWMTALGAFFAIVVVKEFFGGIGANVFNPALAGRAFLLMSFPAAITTWSLPTGLRALFGGIVPDTLTGATPLGILKQGGSIADVGADFALNGLASSPEYGDTLFSLFIGNRGGCIGESSILLILAGAIYLLATKTIDWRASVTMVCTAFVVSFLFGADPVFAVLSGGLLFGAVFMATDYVSAPLTAKGKLIFGAGAGLMTVLIRNLGSYPEGVTYGILIMNAVTPYLNRLLQKKYGFVPRKKVSPPKAAESKGAAK